jgi:DNA-directed RNA polymerase subunit E'/Rpb7
MAFFVVELRRAVHMHPKFFGVRLRDRITQRLAVEVEGTFAGTHGFIVCVLQVVEPFPEGELDDTSGFAVFNLNYRAVVFRPFKGEVLDSVVTKVVQHGFFAESGPLTIFVSHHLLPPGMEFDVAHESWVSHANDERIGRESAVRLRILGLKIEATTISATGSVKDDYTGPI